MLSRTRTCFVWFSVRQAWGLFHWLCRGMTTLPRVTTWSTEKTLVQKWKSFYVNSLAEKTNITSIWKIYFTAVLIPGLLKPYDLRGAFIRKKKKNQAKKWHGKKMKLIALSSSKEKKTEREAKELQNITKKYHRNMRKSKSPHLNILVINCEWSRKW